MKLNIAHITNSYTPFKGGVVQAIKALVAQQQQDGHNPLIVTLDFGSTDQSEQSYVHRIPTFLKCTYAQNSLAVPWRLAFYLRTILASLGCSVIHTHHPFLLGPAALRYARKNSIPTVFTFHTLYEEYVHYIKLNPLITKPLTRMCVRFFCNQVDSILVPNKNIQKYVEELGVETHITVLPSPIGNDIVPATPPTFSPQVHSPLRLLVVSRLVPEKNIESIIACMQLLAGNVELIIAGYGYWYDHLKVYIEKIYGRRKPPITFCLNPSRAQLAELYAWADIFLFGSKTDTQGLVLAESMAHATPVIALYGPGQQEIIVNGINGFLVDCPEAMAVAIKNIAAHPRLFLTLQRGALETSKQYQTKVIVNKLIEHYHQVIAQYKPRSWYSAFLKRVI